MTTSTIISNNLRHLLKMHDELSVTELARQTGIPQPTLHHLLNGLTKKPRRVVLEKLATFFALSISQLIGEFPLPQNIPDSIKKSFNISTVPIIDWDMVINWPNRKNSIKQLAEITLDKSIDPNAFALIMQNTIKDVPFPEHAILIFDPSKQITDRGFALVHLMKEQVTLFNRIFIENGNYFIKQEQPNGDMMLTKIKSDSDRILGVLTEVRLQF